MNPIEFKLKSMTLRIWKNAAGEKHRLDGPAVEVIYDDGSYTNEYWINGQAPMNAVHFEYSNGVTFWTIGSSYKLVTGWDVEKIKRTIDWEEIVTAPNAFALFLTAEVKQDKILLTTGAFEKIEVPKKWFTPSGDGTAPDFTDVEVVDYGHGVRFGKYEAATDAIFDEILTPVQKMDKLIKFIDYKLGNIPYFPDRVENMSERELAIVNAVSVAVALAETSKRAIEDIKQEVINAQRRD